MEVKEGVMQDATFITSDPSHARADKPSKILRIFEQSKPLVLKASRK